MLKRDLTQLFFELLKKIFFELKFDGVSMFKYEQVFVIALKPDRKVHHYKNSKDEQENMTEPMCTFKNTI